MPGDPFKSLQPGDPLPTSIQTWNPLLEQARGTKATVTPSAPESASRLGPNEVLVRCDAGFAADRFEMGFLMDTTTPRTNGALDTVVVTDSANAKQYADQPVFKWVRSITTPLTGGSASAQKAWPTMAAVLQQPLKIGQIGRAAVAGPTPVLIHSDAGAGAGSSELGYVYKIHSGTKRAIKAPFGWRLLSAANAEGVAWVNLSQSLWSAMATMDGFTSPRTTDLLIGGQGNFLFGDTDGRLRLFGSAVGTYKAYFYRWWASEIGIKWEVSGVHDQVKASMDNGYRIVPVQMMADGRWYILNWDPFDRSTPGINPFAIGGAE